MVKKETSPKKSAQSSVSKSYAAQAIDFIKAKIKEVIDFIKAKTKDRQTVKKAGGQKKKSKAERESDEFTQDIIPVKEIKGGIIITTNGRCVKVMELQASNYEQMSADDKNNILYNFDRIFKIAPSKMQFMTLSEHINVDKMIQNVKSKNAGVHTTNVQMALDDYIAQLNGLNRNLGLIKRYYIIFEYEGSASPSTDAGFNEIYYDIMNTACAIENVLKSANTPVVHHDNENDAIYDFLYNYYNKKSAITESFINRYFRIVSDRKNYYAKSNAKDPGIDIRDLFAPRGMDFSSHKDYCMADGIYYTYIAITDSGYPEALPATWINYVFGHYGVGVDTDFYIKKLPKEMTKFRLEKDAAFKRSAAISEHGNASKAEELMRKANNSTAILNAMKNGEDIYNCVTIATLWDVDPYELMRKRIAIVKDLTSKGIKVETSHLDCLQYFKMTAPFLDIQNEIFSRNAHNFLTWSLGSIYNMTSYQLYDPTGFPIGYNMLNKSIVCFNNFNTAYFKNGNMCITGTSGAGKSFTLMFIGRNLFLNGIGTYYILPEKGYEYEDACKSLDGQYIMLMPGSKDCINILEIRPQISYKMVDGVEEDIDIKADVSQSLLAKKVAAVTVWIQLLLTEGDAKITSVELYKLNDVITKLYGEFGITDDNNSIYDENGNLKRMPIIEDLYNVLLKDNELYRLAVLLTPFVSGSCKNMNQQTNVDLRSKCIVFNVDETSIGENLLSAFMYIAFDCSYDLVKSDADNFDTIFMDEIWKMMKNEACAKQVQKLVKLIRGYGGSTIVATQEIKDFLASAGGFGASVISNSAINFIMQINDKDERKRICELMSLSNDDMKIIAGYERGCGMLIANGVKVNVEVKASELEKSLFTTDLNVKRAFAEKRKRLEQLAIIEQQKSSNNQ